LGRISSSTGEKKETSKPSSTLDSSPVRSLDGCRSRSRSRSESKLELSVEPPTSPGTLYGIRRSADLHPHLSPPGLHRPFSSSESSLPPRKLPWKLPWQFPRSGQQFQQRTDFQRSEDLSFHPRERRGRSPPRVNPHSGLHRPGQAPTHKLRSLSFHRPTRTTNLPAASTSDGLLKRAKSDTRTSKQPYLFGNSRSSLAVQQKASRK